MCQGIRSGGEKPSRLSCCSLHENLGVPPRRKQRGGTLSVSINKVPPHSDIDSAEGTLARGSPCSTTSGAITASTSAV